MHWEVGIDPQTAYGGRKKKREGLYAASLHTIKTNMQCRHKSWRGGSGGGRKIREGNEEWEGGRGRGRGKEGGEQEMEGKEEEKRRR